MTAFRRCRRALAFRLVRTLRAALPALLLLLPVPATLLAGGPRSVAGTTWFNPSVAGQPVRWPTGQVSYFVDQGPLSSSIDNQQATAMVDAAAALWSAVPTAGVVLTHAGSLHEDVSGSNTVPGNQIFAAPADVTPTATATPIAVVFDQDGSVIDALYGSGASDPLSCQSNGAMPLVDNIQPDATIAHAVILVNGLCTDTDNRVAMLSFLMERAFGAVLGLGASQVNPYAETSGQLNAALAWPIMQPSAGFCGSSGGVCVPNGNTLQLDDIASLNRLYPITAANLAAFPGKQLTAPNTLSISGTLTFASGMGMQGVNVVLRPLDPAGNPLYEDTVTFVTGAYFNGNRGNPVTGWTGSDGALLTKWGSADPSLQGYFDLTGVPLPAGITTADYQLSFEAMDPLFILSNAVGPYVLGTPTPSGTLPTLTLGNLSAGSVQTLTVPVPDSALGGPHDAIATATQPRPLPGSGMWAGRISQVGQTDWFLFPVRANRTFTVVTQALDEQGVPSNNKALPSIGVWDAFDTPAATSVGWAPGLNGNAPGETWLRVATSADDYVRIAVADLRGDGRPDYHYNGWLLYADAVFPTHLPVTGGPIVIHGSGFRPSDTVLINGQPATVTSVSPNEVTAIAPASGGTTGSVDVEVDDLPVFYAAAIISGGLSYDAGSSDALTLVTAPSNTVPIGIPLSFTVKALGTDGAPAAGVTVQYALTGGAATLGCGSSSCAVTTGGDGLATLPVTATTAALAAVTASLTNGSTLQSHFTGGSAPVLSALTPTLSLAAGSSFNWITQALVLNNGAPVGGQSVTWQTGSGDIGSLDSTAALSNSSGVAAKTLTVSPLAEGTQASSKACVNGTSNCTTFTVLGARPEYAYLEAVAGTAQSLPASGTPALIVLRVRDMDGNPLAGATVTFAQTLYAWAPACPSHGRCAQPERLATQSATATSAVDGTVTFMPAALPGVATNLAGLAATGNTGTLAIAIEQYP